MNNKILKLEKIALAKTLLRQGSQQQINALTKKINDKEIILMREFFKGKKTSWNCELIYSTLRTSFINKFKAFHAENSEKTLQSYLIELMDNLDFDGERAVFEAVNGNTFEFTIEANYCENTDSHTNIYK